MKGPAVIATPCGMAETRTRQLIYRSTARRGADADLILEQSRHNNAIDGVTGILWFNGVIFLQVLEGSSLSVAETFARIGRDERHADVVIISDRLIDEREFGYWSMEGQPFSGSDGASLSRLSRKISDLPDDVRDRVFETLTC